MLTTVPFKSMPGLKTPVAKVMHHGFVALAPAATLVDVAAAMRDNGVHAVLITGEGSKPLGWVTSRGMLHNHARDWTVTSSAGNAVTEPAVSVPANATLADALTAFIASGASHVLVTAATSAEPIGVIADSDLVGYMAQGSRGGRR